MVWISCRWPNSLRVSLPPVAGAVSMSSIGSRPKCCRWFSNRCSPFSCRLNRIRKGLFSKRQKLTWFQLVQSTSPWTPVTLVVLNCLIVWKRYSVRVRWWFPITRWLEKFSCIHSVSRSHNLLVVSRRRRWNYHPNSFPHSITTISVCVVSNRCWLLQVTWNVNTEISIQSSPCSWKVSSMWTCLNLRQVIFHCLLASLGIIRIAEEQ